MALTRGWRILLLLAAIACSKRDAPRSLGRAVVSGAVAALRASPDGMFLAYLHGCQPLKDPTLPRDAAACQLSVVPGAGGTPVRVAAGVTSLGHGFGWAQSGHLLAALGEYDHAAGRGRLVVWDGGDPRLLAPDVTFHGFDRDGGRLGWIAGGQLFVAEAKGGPAARVEGADLLSTFEFGSHGELLARRTARAGAALLLARGAVARTVASDVQEYGFAPGGATFAFTAGPAQSLAIGSVRDPEARIRTGIGRDVHAFLFSPRSDRVAYIADATPGRQGDLWTVTATGAPVLLARNVGEPRWSQDGSRLAWLQGYDPRSRTGSLALGAPGAPARVVARTVSDFDVSPDGQAIAGLVHDTAAGYSVNLALSVRDAPPVTVARGVFGFGFSPDGRWLYFRTACTREAEACDVLRIPASGLPAGSSPERIAEGAKSFEFAPGRPDRLLVTWARKDRIALDLAVWEAGRLIAIDTSAVPGSARFLGGGPSRIAWIGNDPKRAGLFVADVP